MSDPCDEVTVSATIEFNFGDEVQRVVHLTDIDDLLRLLLEVKALMTGVEITVIAGLEEEQV